jgi:tRNA(Arg) A34 adenosine deaminase TadA
MTAQDDARYMRLAIDASRAALAKGNMPYGAALVSSSGELLHVSENNQFTTGDCTGHAEVALIREACAKLGPTSLEGATVYASGEPCAMCAGALFWARVARVVFGAPNETLMRLGGKPTLAINSALVLAAGSHQVKVDGPLLEEEAAAVIAQKR